MLVHPPSPLLEPDERLAVAVGIVAGYAPVDDDQAAVRARFLAFTDRHPDALHRHCAPGHLTGSALVVSAAGDQVLLLHHAKLAKWLQPGGHADGDGNLVHVAWREATEETGIDGLAIHSVPIDLDVHRVEPPGEAPHDHFDVRFLVVAPAGAVAEGNHESTAMRWVRWNDVASLTSEAGLHRLVRAGRTQFGWR